MFYHWQYLKNWLWILDFEEPLWDVELFGRLTLCLTSSDYISLASCLQVCVGHPLLLCSWLFWGVCTGLDKMCNLATGGCRKKFSLAESFEQLNDSSSRNLKNQSLFLQIFRRLIIYLVKTFCRLDYLIICSQHRN